MYLRLAAMVPAVVVFQCSQQQILHTHGVGCSKRAFDVDDGALESSVHLGKVQVRREILRMARSEQAYGT